MGSDPFTTDDGTALAVGKLVWASLVVLAGAVFGGAADVVQSLFNAFIITPLDSLASFAESVVSGSYGVLTEAARGAWVPTTQFVGDFGVVSFAVALVFVIATAYILARGWSYVE